MASTSPKPQKIPKLAEVTNKTPAEIEITAEQLLREAKERDFEILPPDPEVEFTLGCLLKLTGLGCACSREDLKEALGEFGKISFVDYVRGNPEAVVRFKSGVAAKVLEKAEGDGEKKFSIGSCKATVSVVEGESEKEYWKSIARNKASFRQKRHNQYQRKQRKRRFKEQ